MSFGKRLFAITLIQLSCVTVCYAQDNATDSHWLHGSAMYGRKSRTPVLDTALRTTRAKDVQLRRKNGEVSPDSGGTSSGFSPSVPLPGIGSLFGAISPLSGTERGLSDVRQGLAELRSPISELTRPLNTLRGSVDRLGEPLSSVEGALSRLERPLTDLQIPIDKLNKPLTSLQQPITDLRKPVADLRAPIGSLRGSVASIQRPLQGLTGSTRQLQAPIANLRKPLSQVSSQLQALKEPLSGISKPIRQLPADVNLLSSSVATLRGEVRQLHTQIGNLHGSIESIAHNVSLAVIAGALTVAAALFMHRKVPSKSQPTVTTVETIEEQPVKTAAVQYKRRKSGAPKRPSTLQKKKVSVVKTEPVDETGHSTGAEQDRRAT